MAGLGKQIVVVSGLPRSGTSMLMRMLDAGGIEVFTDGARTADVDNPNGYYEVEKVKALKKDQDKAWIAGAQGKAIKIVSSLLRDLPPEHSYSVVFANRHLPEVLASQDVMRRRAGDDTPANDAELTMLYERHLDSVKKWMARQSNFRVLELTYSDVVQNPGESARQIQTFLNVPLDLERMIGSVDAALYRNRRSTVTN
jgi:hypothetical protein